MEKKFKIDIIKPFNKVYIVVSDKLTKYEQFILMPNAVTVCDVAADDVMMALMENNVFLQDVS